MVPGLTTDTVEFLRWSAGAIQERVKSAPESRLYQLQRKKQQIESEISTLDQALNSNSNVKLKLQTKRNIENTLKDIATFPHTAINLQIQKLEALIKHLQATIQKLTTYQMKKGVAPTLSPSPKFPQTRRSSIGQFFSGIVSGISAWYKSQTIKKDFWALISFLGIDSAEKCYWRLDDKENFRNYKLEQTGSLVKQARIVQTSAQAILDKLQAIKDEKSEVKADAVLFAKDLEGLEVTLTEQLGEYRQLFTKAESDVVNEAAQHTKNHQEDASYYSSTSVIQAFKDARELPLQLKL